MDKLRTSAAAKTAAFILCVLLILLFSASVFGIAVLYTCGAYVSPFEEARTELLDRVLTQYSDSVLRLIHNGAGPSEIRDAFRHKNLLYSVYVDGILWATNHDGQTAVSEVEQSLEMQTARIYFDVYEDETKTGKDPTEETNQIDVRIGCPETYKYSDELSFADNFIRRAYHRRFMPVIAAAAALIANIALTVFLLSAAGRSKNCDGIRAGLVERIPLDVHAVLLAVFIWLVISAATGLSADIPSTAVSFAIAVFLCYSAFLGSLISLAVRIKCGGTLKNTLVFRLLILLRRFAVFAWKGLVNFISSLPLMWKTVLTVMIYAGFNLVAILVAMIYHNPAGAVIWSAGWIVLLIVACRLTSEIRKLDAGVQRISQGDYGHPVDVRGMSGDFKKYAENVNSIGGGMSLALEEKLKSEKFKTELITNVSHDIKTPLTSIINYIDLIDKEGDAGPNVKEYIAVLKKQADRLKKLTEDLIEASKASTGNLTVNAEECDLCELIRQVSAEYQERFDGNDLKLVAEIPEEPVKIMADGRHLWRIIDNLMNNIVKYTMKGTRVYVDLLSSGGNATLIFRNISNYPLSRSADELTERFVRGDVSRHSEGSGLGLSIAKSLAELQGGTLDLSTDGDLFKAVLSFEQI